MNITEAQAAMLADIFRIMLKEIVVDEDKSKLAPGELGINYTNGSLYVKNPHTGELFSPNGIDNIQLILSKFNTLTGELNADSINDIYVYNSISEVSSETIGPDTLVANMKNNSILISLVDFSTNIAIGYPTESGILYIYKLDNSTVYMSYNDKNTYTEYTGIYESDLHQFVGWRIKGLDTSRFAEISEITSNIATIDFAKVPKDLCYITLRPMINIDLSTTTFTINNIPGYVVTNSDYTPMNSTLAANARYQYILDSYSLRLVQVADNISPLEEIINVINSRTITTTDGSHIIIDTSI